MIVQSPSTSPKKLKLKLSRFPPRCLLHIKPNTATHNEAEKKDRIPFQKKKSTHKPLPPPKSAHFPPYSS